MLLKLVLYPAHTWPRHCIHWILSIKHTSWLRIDEIWNVHTLLHLRTGLVFLLEWLRVLSFRFKSTRFYIVSRRWLLSIVLRSQAPFCISMDSGVVMLTSILVLIKFMVREVFLMICSARDFVVSISPISAGHFKVLVYCILMRF